MWFILPNFNAKLDIKMKKSLLIILATVLFACNTNQKEQVSNNQEEELPDEVKIEQKLFDEVMEVHDEMMPKMEGMMRLKGILTEAADSLRENGNESLAETYAASITDLENADNAMMNWMRQFDGKMKDMTHDERVTYLSTQKAKMDSVKLVMADAISNAQKMVGND